MQAQIKKFFQNESKEGFILFFAAVAAIISKNSVFSDIYDHFLETPIHISIGEMHLNKPSLLWINDGLMAVFFLLVGLEIKREFIEGELSDKTRAYLPMMAAVGGMVFPALVFLYFNIDSPEDIKGWAIPAATDIAFALGVLALLGNKIPNSLKIFLLALAIIDDLGVIIIIALFYTTDLSVFSLLWASFGMMVLMVFNSMEVRRIAPYLLVGVFTWVCVLKSGIHATLAGVLIALTIPLRVKGKTMSPAIKLEKNLYPWVSLLILPLFAYANAGVALGDLHIDSLFHDVSLGIAFGLFFGKQFGVMLFTWLSIKLNFAEMPKNVTWMQIYGTSLLTGIGFTMSLFIGTLAFSKPEYAALIRLGVLTGSFVSGVAGYSVLKYSIKKN
jgi:NhaA family Na+:H+ antiporter